MELNEFIQVTLTQIINGVEAAQKDKSHNAVICPNGNQVFVNLREEGELEKSPYPIPLANIEYDIAITETTSDKGKVTLGVLFTPLGFGASGEKSEENVSYNRIKFTIPVVLPSQNTPYPSNKTLVS